METEIEAKWLRCDLDEMRNRLERSGAVCRQKERKMVRCVYDFSDERLEKIGGWVRVRNEGNVVTMSYKQLNDRTLHGTKEVTLEVNSYEEAKKFLQAIGLVQKSIQETKRESWTLNGASIELDTWPWIQSFIEIEAPSEEILRTVAAALELDFSAALHGSVETAYMAEYNVTEPEVNSWKEILFSTVPEWLEAKRK